MLKLLALYKLPAEPESFLRHYKNVHVPLLRQVPGLLKIEVTEVLSTIMGEPGNFLLAEMFFPTMTPTSKR